MLRLPLDDLAARVEPFLRDAGLWSEEFRDGRRAWFLEVLALLRPRVKRVGQFAEDGRPFFEDAVQYEPDAVKKHMKPELREPFDAWRAVLMSTEPFEPAALEAALRRFAESGGVKAASLIHATRVAVTGRAASPGLFEVIVLVGRERTLARMTSALALFG